MKNSFILHSDSLIILDSLNDEQAGRLFKAMLTYHTTGQLPEDVVLKVAIMPFVNQWKRDLAKFDKVCERNRLNGTKGGRPKNPVGILGTQQNPTEPKKAENENDNDNDKENNKKERFVPPTIQEVVAFFTSNGFSAAHANHVFNYYQDASWKDANGKQVKNWKQKMRGVWFREEYKQQAKLPYDPRSGNAAAVYTSPDKYRPV